MNTEFTQLLPTQNQAQYGRRVERLIIPYINYFPTSTIGFDMVEKDEAYDFLEWVESTAVTIALDAYFCRGGYFSGNRFLINGVSIMDNLMEDFYNHIPGDIESRADAINAGCLYDWLFVHEVSHGSSEFYDYCVSIETSAYNTAKHLEYTLAVLGEHYVQFIDVDKLKDGTGFIVTLEF